MKRHLAVLLGEPAQARELAARGHCTIHSRHTCAHRVDELMDVLAALDAEPELPVAPRPRQQRAARPAAVLAKGGE